MSDLTLIIISILISGILSGVAGFVIKLLIDQRSQIASKNAIDQQIRMAQERSQEILIEAKEKSLQFRLESEKEINKQRNQVQQEMAHANSLRNDANKKPSENETGNKKISDQIKLINNQKDELNKARELYAKKIEEASDISLDEAKNILMKEAQEDIEHNLSLIHI